MPVALALVRAFLPVLGVPSTLILATAVIYGFILIFILQCFLGASLAEFVSAYPTNGGMYHWIAAIAPKRYNASLSFATGWSTVVGCKCDNHLFITHP